VAANKIHKRGKREGDGSGEAIWGTTRGEEHVQLRTKLSGKARTKGGGKRLNLLREPGNWIGHST